MNGLNFLNFFAENLLLGKTYRISYHSSRSDKNLASLLTTNKQTNKQTNRQTDKQTNPSAIYMLRFGGFEVSLFSVSFLQTCWRLILFFLEGPKGLVVDEFGGEGWPQWKAVSTSQDGGNLCRKNFETSLFLQSCSKGSRTGDDFSRRLNFNDTKFIRR